MAVPLADYMTAAHAAAAQAATAQAGLTQQQMYRLSIKEPVAERLELMVSNHQSASIASQPSVSLGGAAGAGVGLAAPIRRIPHLQQSVEQQHGQVLALIWPSRVQAGQHCFRQPVHEVCLPLHTCSMH